MSLTDFDIDEVFRIALHLERIGARFYRRAAEKSVDSVTRDLLLDIAEKEEKHEKVFATMRERWGERTKIEPGPPNRGQSSILQAIVDGQVFDVEGDPAQKMTGAESMEEILWMAIRLEKDSIIFYLGIKEAIADEEEREQIDEIIREEMKHVAEFSGHLAVLRHKLQ